MNTTIERNHMVIQWHNYAKKFKNTPISEANLEERSILIGRVGLMLLSCGTAAWRVRRAMNMLAKALDVTCTMEIGFTTLNYTCFDDRQCFSQTLSLTNNGVNTNKLHALTQFVEQFSSRYLQANSVQIHETLDAIDQMPGLYSSLQLGLASAVACASFTFLLGGGPAEMFGALIGAGIGNDIRAHMQRRKLTQFLCIMVSVSIACLCYTLSLRCLEHVFDLSTQHEIGYICSMLFIIPGFPFITSGFDFAKSDMHSGLERMSFFIMTVTVACITGWIMAYFLGLEPGSFLPMTIAPQWKVMLWLVFSFGGVFGFSMMFNSPMRLCALAAIIGSLSNTLRLGLVNYADCPAALGAFIGAMTAGLLAYALHNRYGYPRIAVTVPSIVIMVPGLYLYRGFYGLGTQSIDEAMSSLMTAVIILLCIPLGLIFARILTDPDFRHCT